MASVIAEGTPAKPALSFLFWNLAGRNLTDEVRALTESYSPDVIVLAEFDGISASGLLLKLNASPAAAYHLPDAVSRRLLLVTRFNRGFLTPAQSQRPDSRW